MDLEYSADDVCKLLSISRTTLSRRVHDGELIPIGGVNKMLKRQRNYKFKRSDIDALLSQE